MGDKTSHDVARLLGIAQSTVSRAFTPGASISPGLRARVRAAAESIGYRPNLLARGLAAGQSRLIGLVIAPQTNLLYPELIYELSRQLAERGRQLMLLPAEDEAGAALACERLRSYRADGVVATGVIGERTAKAIVSGGVPLVTFNRLIPGVPGVSCDFAAGSASLARRLLDAGHRSFGFIGGPRESWVSNTALRGFRAAIREAQDARLAAVRAAFSYDDAGAALARLERRAGAMPTAVLCVSDMVAAGCRDHLHRSGSHAVSSRPAVVTFLTNGVSRWSSYGLTGCAQPTVEMIQAVTNMICGPAPSNGPNHELVAPDMVNRIELSERSRLE